AEMRAGHSGELRDDSENKRTGHVALRGDNTSDVCQHGGEGMTSTNIHATGGWLRVGCGLSVNIATYLLKIRRDAGNVAMAARRGNEKNSRTNQFSRNRHGVSIVALSRPIAPCPAWVFRCQAHALPAALWDGSAQHGLARR